MKKVVSLILLLVVCFSTGITAFAAENQTSETIVVYEKTQAEIDEEVDRQIQEQLERLQAGQITPRNSHGGSQWKTESGPKKTVTVSGFAGDQLSGGYRFPTGGGFYHSNSGGPSVGASVSFPTPYLSVGISVSMGNKSGSGTWVSAPDRTSYWKLYVAKDVEVQPYIVYKKQNGAWRVWYRGTTQVIKRFSVSVRKA